MPTQNSSVISMTYSGDLQSNDQSIASLNNVYMQEIVDGYNLSYTYTCSYRNETGGAEDCSEILVDQTLNQPYTFFIEQVTSTNRIVRSFTMNRLIVMLDTKKNLNLLQLQNNNLDLDSINYQQLETLVSYP